MRARKCGGLVSDMTCFSSGTVKLNEKQLPNLTHVISLTNLPDVKGNGMQQAELVSDMTFFSLGSFGLL